MIVTRRSWIACTAGAGLHMASSCLVAESKEVKAANEYKSEQLLPYLQATEWTLYSLYSDPWNTQQSGDPFAEPTGNPNHPLMLNSLPHPKRSSMTMRCWASYSSRKMTS